MIDPRDAAIRDDFDSAVDSEGISGKGHDRLATSRTGHWYRRKKVCEKTGAEVTATDLFHGGGFRIETAGARRVVYLSGGVGMAERQRNRSRGLVADVFHLAIGYLKTEDIHDGKWRLGLIYELGQRLRETARMIRVLDGWLGNKKNRYADLLELGAPEKVDGVYRFPCSWCGRWATAKKSNAHLCPGSTCRQAWRRAGIRAGDWVLNSGHLYRKIASDTELLEGIRSIAMVSYAPSSGVMNRAADALDTMNSDLVELAIRFHTEKKLHPAL
jgi:hypothetical protein